MIQCGAATAARSIVPVVEDAAVAHPAAALGHGDDLAERITRFRCGIGQRYRIERMFDALEDLNPEQQAAVLHDGGHLLIVAGAGSGKTRTLACRVARLLAGGVRPERILLLTFSRRAAREMLTRAGQLAETEGARRVWGGTFHAVGNRLLRAVRRCGRAAVRIHRPRPGRQRRPARPRPPRSRPRPSAAGAFRRRTRWRRSTRASSTRRRSWPMSSSAPTRGAATTSTA